MIIRYEGYMIDCRREKDRIRTIITRYDGSKLAEYTSLQVPIKTTVRQEIECAKKALYRLDIGLPSILGGFDVDTE